MVFQVVEIQYTSSIGWNKMAKRVYYIVNFYCNKALNLSLQKDPCKYSTDDMVSFNMCWKSSKRTFYGLKINSLNWLKWYRPNILQH